MPPFVTIARANAKKHMGARLFREIHRLVHRERAPLYCSGPSEWALFYQRGTPVETSTLGQLPLLGFSGVAPSYERSIPVWRGLQA